ncbi:hypothetical protein [Cupriavidus sp. YR651]|uniref:hypothetical protein n=1 Tax=Cupriavidus sp. YR651 TaxID=1855315 RepID=UPI0015A09E39|nr:hypothetical protein [Cupriavidus sp. YR651]
MTAHRPWGRRLAVAIVAAVVAVMVIAAACAMAGAAWLDPGSAAAWTALLAFCG